jgi:hypothetical protein
MRLIPIVLAAVGTLTTTQALTRPAAAQYIDLSGSYRCVQLCVAGAPQPAFINQLSRELSLVNEAGIPGRGWIDWIGHIWVETWQQGAIYSPDGMVIQFDRGTVWQRQLEPVVVPGAGAPPPPPPPPSRVVRRGAPPPPPAARERVAVARDAYDGPWSVVITTQNGPCDPQYRFGVQIVDGNIVYDGGGPATAQGRVAPNGAVWVHVSGAGNQATGEGRLARETGYGSWRGQGPGGTCAGTWQAVRRG